MSFNLPPELKSRVAHVLADVRELFVPVLGPVAAPRAPAGEGSPSQNGDAAKKALAGLQDALRKFWETLNPTSARTLGGTFKHLAIVGLNKTEMLLAGEQTPISAANWQEITDDTMRKHLGMIFFAPRGLDGEPVNPYLFLTENTLQDHTALAPEDDETGMSIAEAQLDGFALLDFCRMSPAMPNTVNMLVGADVLFHWDVKDSYVLPTTPTTWVRDVEQVLKTYPRTTRAHIYTQWDTDLMPPNDRMTLVNLRDMPLDAMTWVNQPTVQEAYGGQALLIGLLAAGLAIGALWWQAGVLGNVEEDVRTLEQSIPKEGRFAEMNRSIGELEKMLAMREIFFLTVKDTARAIDQSDTQIANFEVKTPDANEVPTHLVVTVETAKNAYNGWIEEEPVAKNLMLHSALLAGIRKPPSTVFRLEGLVEIRPNVREYKRLMEGKSLKPGQAGYVTAAKAFAAKQLDDARVQDAKTEESSE
ncbi:MAG: hypothetical protein COY40_01285 [Alphaproteobacteria bacterium CG_4_10_14_0_8_um_filter_53_9]|nr:MAG: hypothetical protein COY40_01285 [Alphaproteobacteria bacterium CG_4_10_14_0_8_um_filter_53_9]